MSVALLFIDGVGIGRKDPAVNPLASLSSLLSHFVDAPGEALPDGGEIQPVDATFGVRGRPQSASNQTAILTGEPAPALIGRHVLGFPTPPLRGLLLAKSIVRRMVEAKRTATFVNCYPAGYLDALGLARRPSSAADVSIPPRAVRRLRPSATTLAFAAAHVPLRTLDDARAGLGLTNDIDGERANARGFSVPRRTPEEAAQVFWRTAAGADFALFEHYLADEAGHARDWPAALAALTTFDCFARAVIAQRPAGAQVLVCSDHGNVEDLSTRSHTLGQVPVLGFGLPKGALRSLRSVADVGVLVLELLGLEGRAVPAQREAAS
ncbi:MAG: metalloenzyme [Myxococcota bacterium]